jgi:hypothetical protein
MPWSRQCGVVVSATWDYSANSPVALSGGAKPEKPFRSFGKQDIAAAEIAEETNCLREKPWLLLIVPSLLYSLRHSPAAAGQYARALCERNRRPRGFT